jgi:hypothetical protein
MAERRPRPFVEVLAWMLAILREHWRLLLLAGLVIFVPVALLETVDASAQDSLAEADDFLSVAEAIGLAVVDVSAALLGQIVFAGFISALATTGEQPGGGLRGVLRELPVGRLIVADFAFVLVIVAGLVALVVPGLIFLVWFSLIGPVLEVERIGVVAAFRRSRELVRGRFWLVAAFVLPITVAEGAIEHLIQSASLWSLGDTFAGNWASGTVTTLVTSALVALAVSVLYLELSGAGSSPRTRPRGSRRPHRGKPA